EENMADTHVARSRDYTPTRFARFEELFPRVLGRADRLSTGGAPVFAKFLRTELMPFLEQNFAIDTADATLAGGSFGGLCATYLLLSDPSLFRRYIICSPSLLYDDGVMFRQEETYAGQHTDLAATVFMGCGALENEEDNLRRMQSWPAVSRESFVAI